MPQYKCENDLKYKTPRILLLILEISYLIADWSGVYVYLVAPAGGDVVDGVPATAEEQQRRAETPQKANAPGVAGDGQALLAEPVAGASRRRTASRSPPAGTPP